MLNRSGPLNLIIGKRNERRPWTPSSLRKTLKTAEAELDFRKAMEDETEQQPSDTDPVMQKADALEAPEAEVSDADLYTDNPLIGRF